jgi:cell division protein FtsI (penicillin-binding protein 3)
LSESSNPPTQADSQTPPAVANAGVVVEVPSGLVVPSFLGKPLRSAVEIAQQSGVEINALGSGVAREQWPAPGSRLPSGQHITVRFEH